jgi:hypothetical protein
VPLSLKAQYNAGKGLGRYAGSVPGAAEQQFFQGQQQPPAQQAPQGYAQAPQGYQQPPQGQYPQQPQQAPQAPPGAAPSCMHGVKKYVEGTNAQGKAYKFWGCPAAKGDPSQCKPQWIN